MKTDFRHRRFYTGINTGWNHCDSLGASSRVVTHKVYRGETTLHSRPLHVPVPDNFGGLLSCGNTAGQIWLPDNVGGLLSWLREHCGEIWYLFSAAGVSCYPPTTSRPCSVHFTLQATLELREITASRVTPLGSGSHRTPTRATSVQHRSIRGRRIADDASPQASAHHHARPAPGLAALVPHSLCTRWLRAHTDWNNT